MKNYRLFIFIFLCVFLLWNIVFVVDNHLFSATDTIINITTKISVCGNHIKEGGEHCDGSDVGGKSCSNLGFTIGGNLNCSASCEFDTSNCTTNAETTSIPLFSSSTGGEYTISNNNNSALVTLPQNFYTQDLRLQMFLYNKNVTEALKPPPSGKHFIGKTYDFIFVDTSGSTVPTLSQSAILTLTYTDADASGIDENTLAPYRQSSTDISWQVITGSTLDTVNNQVTFSTVNFSSFTLFGSLAQQQEQTSGGGGGSSAIPQTIINFIGKAYPGTRIVLLKDAQTIATTTANTDASFRISIAVSSSGNYIFGLYSEDKKNNRSVLLTYPKNIVFGTTTDISGIVINQPTALIIKGDFNNDKKINLVDFSIAAYWYKRLSPPDYIDLNKDGHIDLIDFSIMAYYWTD